MYIVCYVYMHIYLIVINFYGIKILLVPIYVLTDASCHSIDTFTPDCKFSRLDRPLSIRVIINVGTKILVSCCLVFLTLQLTQLFHYWVALIFVKNVSQELWSCICDIHREKLISSLNSLGNSNVLVLDPQLP